MNIVFFDVFSKFRKCTKTLDNWQRKKGELTSLEFKANVSVHKISHGFL